MLVLKVWLHLSVAALITRIFGGPSLCRYVAAHRNKRVKPLSEEALGRLTKALKKGRRFHLLRCECLEESIAITYLLREYGPQICIGVRTLPFSSHAWVEVNGKAVNEDPYMVRPTESNGKRQF